MATDTTYYCDSCNKKLNEEALKDNIKVKLEYAEQQKSQGMGAQHVTEIFCPRHLEHAPEFWDAKLQLTQEVFNLFNTRTEKLRRTFFNQYQEVAV